MRISDWSSDVCSSDLAELAGRHAELLLDIFGAEPAVVHRVVEIESGLDELHQILVRRDDRHLPALRQRGLGVTGDQIVGLPRSEEHTSELLSLMRISYAVLCLKKKKQNNNKYTNQLSL